MTNRQTYRYIKQDSILHDERDDYELIINEYYRLYNFYVTNSMVGFQSLRKKTFLNYGWSDDTLNATKNNGKEIISLHNALKEVLDIDQRNKFVFITNEDTRSMFNQLELQDGLLQNLSDERFVIVKNRNENRYLDLFHHTRNCLAHGKFALKISQDNEKMVIMQDDDKSNVTARIVLKLSSLLNLVEVITKN